MHKHNSKPAGRATTLLFAGFLAVFLLGVVLNIGLLFFQYNTNFVIGTTGFVHGGLFCPLLLPSSSLSAWLNQKKRLPYWPSSVMLPGPSVALCFRFSFCGLWFRIFHT